jgi:NitT/TauT family transport system substrate-binding protein
LSGIHFADRLGDRCARASDSPAAPGKKGGGMRVGVTRRGFAGLAAAAVCADAWKPRPARAQTALKLTLDGKIEGPSAPLMLALEEGAFAAEGLDIAVEPSVGGIEPITRVASGAFDIGVADINVLMRWQDQNPETPLRAVFVINNRPSYAIVGRKSRGVSAPSDLMGRKLGAPAQEPASAQWPLFAKLTNIDASKVTLTNIGIPVREPMLMAGEIDAALGPAFSSPTNLRERGVPPDDITVLLMSNYGMELYGNAIFVTAKRLTESPDAVKAFLRGYLKGLKDTIKDPGKAMSAVLRQDARLNEAMELERLTIAIRDCVVTPEVRANGLGGIEPDRFEVAVNQLAVGQAFKTKPKLSDVFDASAMPPDEDRRLG